MTSDGSSKSKEQFVKNYDVTLTFKLVWMNQGFGLR